MEYAMPFAVNDGDQVYWAYADLFKIDSMAHWSCVNLTRRGPEVFSIHYAVVWACA
jgi:hypothetical protein